MRNDAKFLRTFKQKDGSYETQEWSADEVFNFALVKWVCIGVLTSFLSALASVICLIARLYDYEEGEKQPSYVGIVTSLYFIIDYTQGWIVTGVLSIFEDPNTIKTIFAFNIVLLVTHILLLLFGDVIFYSVEKTIRKTILTLVTLIFVLVSFFIINTITLSVIKTPVYIESATEKEQRINRGNFNTEQERKEYFDKEEKEWGTSKLN